MRDTRSGWSTAYAMQVAAPWEMPSSATGASGDAWSTTACMSSGQREAERSGTSQSVMPQPRSS
jgi:hypothetical protein